jgi:hypothetical protein
MTSPPYDVGYGKPPVQTAIAKASRATPRDAARAALSPLSVDDRPIGIVSTYGSPSQK